MNLTKTNTFLRLSTNSYHKQTKNVKKTKGPNCIGNVKKGKRVQNAAFNWRLLQSSSRFFSFILHLFRVFFFTLSCNFDFLSLISGEPSRSLSLSLYFSAFREFVIRFDSLIFESGLLHWWICEFIMQRFDFYDLIYFFSIWIHSIRASEVFYSIIVNC